MGKELAAILDGIRAYRFDITFSLDPASGNWPRVYVLFNLKDIADADMMYANVNQHTRFVDAGDPDGGVPVRLSGTTPSDWPFEYLEYDSDSPLWFRLVNDGQSVKFLVQKTTSEPTSWDESTQKIYQTTAVDNDGGLLGLAGSDAHYDHLKVRTDRDGDGTYETLEHAEDFTTDANGYAAITPTHDAAGNLTWDGLYAYRYDAWNRLASVTKGFIDPGSGGGSLALGSTVMTARYDGLSRRIVKRIQNSADLNCTYHYYYDAQSVVEMRDGSDLSIKQYVWGVTYIDELIQTAVNEDPLDNAEGDGTQTLCETVYYAATGPNYNVIGLFDASGAIVERYEYTPYGQRRVYTSAGLNDPKAYAPLMMSRRVEDASGVRQPYGINTIGHQGLMHDEAVGLVYNRARMLSPRLGRFLQRDPLGYPDGMNAYAAYHVMRGGVDPSGSVITTPKDLGLALGIHWFRGAGAPFRRGEKGLMGDANIKNRARTEVMSFHNDICKKLKNSGKNSISDAYFISTKPSPRNWYLVKTTNVPSGGFKISSKATATLVKKNGKCVCKSTHQLDFTWRDKADMHPGMDWDVIFWALSQAYVGTEYNIDINWSSSASITNGNPLTVKGGWPMN